MELPGIEGKGALVSGAASGIGFAIARALAAQGARVLICDLRDAAAHAAAAAIASETGGRVEALGADASREEDVAAAVAFAEERFGALDILVSSAGVQHVAPIEEFPIEKFRQIIDLMLVGPFLALRCALPGMRRRGFGRVIQIASINGLVGFAGKAAYNSAKHGLIGLTRVAALETAQDGITVNALCPGYVDTPLVRGQLEDLARTRGVPLERVLEEVIYPLVPQRRLLRAQEVADYACFLASELASGVTGQAVVLDGGYTAQ